MIDGLRERELEILSEFMKDSRQSDREVARKLGVSQPTVTRIRTRLEKQGCIREYTVIPEFSKLGYEIMAMTFGQSRTLSEEETQRARRIFLDQSKSERFGFVMIKRGLGLGFDGVIITYHRDFGSYQRFLRWLRQAFPKDLMDVDKLASFLIDLDDKATHLPFTLSLLADELSRGQQKQLSR
jgi:DNA-binding Lrp family transcriptional regulator